MIGLIDTATVRTRNGTTGAFSTVAQSGLACRLAHVTTRQARNGEERAELVAMRNLIFDPAYTMPELCQIEVNGDGVRWQPVRGTFGAYHGPSGALVYRRCDVVRQGS